MNTTADDGRRTDERDATTAPPARRHTGRRRNIEARQAILTAAWTLLNAPGGDTVSVDAIAREAGVGKQTIYRWWPTKMAVLLEAMDELAEEQVPVPDTGTLAGDLTAFVVSTFRGARQAPTARALRTLAAEAARDEQTARLLYEFTRRRRAALQTLLLRHAGEIAADADRDLLVDQVFGTLWYQVLLGRPVLDDRRATAYANALTGSLTRPGSSPPATDPPRDNRPARSTAGQS